MHATPEASYKARIGELEKELDAYKHAIRRAEGVFIKNKSRMWVLTILRGYLKEELSK